MFLTLFFLSRLFVFDDESDNDGPRSGSSGMCPFQFTSGNYFGCIRGGVSEMMKCYFPFFNGEMVKCFFPFCDGEM